MPALDSRITVVHVITRLELGGAQENTLDTCAGLDPERFEVVLAYGPGGLLDDRAQSARFEAVSVPHLIRPVVPGADVRAERWLAQFLRARLRRHLAAGRGRRRFLVHTHSSKAGILGRLAAWRAGVPTIVHGIHGFGFHPGQSWPKYQLFLNAERAVARVTHGFVGVSQTNLDEARSKGIIGRRHVVRLVRSGMDLAPFRDGPSKAEARRALGLDPSEELILSVANLKPQKDPLTLVRAFARVAAARPRARLLYAGDGELRPAVEAELARTGLGSRVTLLGWRHDIPALVAASDVVALSSIFEGLPRSAVQAVAGRRPFVGTRVDGTPEIIRDGKNGFLVPPGDAEALGRALIRGLDLRPTDPGDQHRVTAWSIERMVAAQAALYEDLVSAPNR